MILNDSIVLDDEIAIEMPNEPSNDEPVNEESYWADVSDDSENDQSFHGNSNKTSSNPNSFNKSSDDQNLNSSREVLTEGKSSLQFSWKQSWLFIFPAICDAMATSSMYVGLSLTSASSYQMLRGNILYCTASTIVYILHLRRFMFKCWRDLPYEELQNILSQKSKYKDLSGFFSFWKT